MAAVQFALFAPYNELVELVGDFSDWKPLPMTKGADGWCAPRCPWRMVTTSTSSA